MAAADRYTRIYKLKPGERIEIDAGSDGEISVALKEPRPGDGRQVRLVVEMPRGRAVRKGGKR